MRQVRFPKITRYIAAALVCTLLAGAAAIVTAAPAQAPLAEHARRACVTVRSALASGSGRVTATATGSGFFVGPDLILTCNHVTRIPMTPRRAVAANRVSVELDGGELVQAEVVARDEDHDLALLRLTGGSRPEIEPLSVTNFSLSKGTQYTIVGDFPDAIRVSSGKLMTDRVMPGFAMGDAKVRSGYSGGPVLDVNGNVQGILSQRDMQNNSIFVKPEAIVALMRRVGASPATRLVRPDNEDVDNSEISVASARVAPVKPTELAVASATTKVSSKRSQRPDLVEAALASVEDAPVRARTGPAEKEKIQISSSSSQRRPNAGSISPASPAKTQKPVAVAEKDSARQAAPRLTIPSSRVETNVPVALPASSGRAASFYSEEEPLVVALPVRRAPSAPATAVR